MDEKKREKNSLIITLTLLGAIFLQVLFVFGHTAETPSKAVMDFAQRYYALDPSMKDRVCSEILENAEIDPVDQYVYTARHETDQRGLSLWMTRQSLDHAVTDVLEKDGDKAKVKFKATHKNGLRKFFSGESHHVEKTVTLKMEDGKWKVCGGFFKM